VANKFAAPKPVRAPAIASALSENLIFENLIFENLILENVALSSVLCTERLVADVLTLVLFSHPTLWKERSNVPHRSPLGAAL
jgi:hypothetical protein